jgi:AcrR family transcriptional regulator
VKSGDRETRARLVKAASQLFGRDGFKKVTVRQICRAARANVASVNYHFGDKTGLYREVLRVAIDTMVETSRTAREAGNGLPPEERLHRYIDVWMRRVAEPRTSGWIHGLLQRELADPTPAFDIAALVNRGIRPRIEALSAIVAEIIGSTPADSRVLRCVASIHAQWIFYLPNPISMRLKSGFHVDAGNIDQVVDHIAAFSLAGIRAVASLPEGTG